MLVQDQALLLLTRGNPWSKYLKLRALCFRVKIRLKDDPQAEAVEQLHLLGLLRHGAIAVVTFLTRREKVMMWEHKCQYPQWMEPLDLKAENRIGKHTNLVLLYLNTLQQQAVVFLLLLRD